MQMHRRTFLTGAIGVTALVTSLPARAELKNIPWEKEGDIVIIGSGEAGMATAVSALENGLKDVVLLEKLGFLGGNTGVATGSFNT